jgi:multidrug efflux pump subunit AcrA (membrane-fusion protein)
VEADGLQAGMQIVVKGQERLREGQPVQVKEN